MGTCKFSIKLSDSFTDNHIFHIMNIENNIIIGNDLLRKWKTKINMEEETILIDNHTLLPLYIQKETEYYHLYATKTIGIPAKSIQQIQVHSDNDRIPINQIMLVSTNRKIIQKRKCSIPTGIINTKKEQNYIINIINLSPSRIIIPRGSTIGLLYKDNNQAINIIETEGKDDNNSNNKEKMEEASQLNNNNASNTSTITIEKLKTIYEQINLLDLTKDSDIDIEQQEKVKQLLKKYAHIMSLNSRSPTITVKTKHYINTQNNPPIKQRSYRTSQVENKTIQKEVTEMLKNNIVKPSHSAWASPVVLAPKSDGSIRFVLIIEN